MNEIGATAFFKMFVIGQNITILTKKTNKAIRVHVSDVQDGGRTFVCWYTNRYGKTDLKRFDMTQYNYCL